MTGTSGRQRVPTDSLSHLLLAMPTIPVAEAFGGLVAPLFERARTSTEESRTLTALRDALLPKLIAGELRVPRQAMLHDLRAEFEQQLELVLSDAGTALIGDLEMTPAAILATDPTAYEGQFASWFYEVWVPPREELLEAILGLHGNRKRYQDLCAAVTESQIVPFVGSGMSAASRHSDLGGISAVDEKLLDSAGSRP